MERQNDIVNKTAREALDFWGKCLVNYKVTLYVTVTKIDILENRFVT